MSTRRPRPPRLRAAAQALLAALGLAAPPADALPTPPIHRLADIRARLLAQDALQATQGEAAQDDASAAPADPVAQWFNWPNWTNWANWNNWDNWNNWVKWSKF